MRNPKIYTLTTLNFNKAAAKEFRQTETLRGVYASVVRAHGAARYYFDADSTKPLSFFSSDGKTDTEATLNNVRAELRRSHRVLIFAEDTDDYAMEIEAHIPR